MGLAAKTNLRNLTSLPTKTDIFIGIEESYRGSVDEVDKWNFMQKFELLDA